VRAGLADHLCCEVLLPDDARARTVRELASKIQWGPPSIEAMIVRADRALGHKKHDPGESVWLAPFQPTGAVLIMPVTAECQDRSLMQGPAV
jgi:hypothetical protein